MSFEATQAPPESLICINPALSPNILANYRAYVIGPDDRFQNVVVFDCVDDSAAIASAERLVDGHAVELWQLGRRIARFERKADGSSRAGFVRYLPHKAPLPGPSEG
jgi:hypothetical protein